MLIDHNKDLKVTIMFIQKKLIRLRSNDDKRLQTNDKITTYPNGINTFKVCESEMLKRKRLIL